MAENSLDKRVLSDSQLTAAVAASRSWRGVMRELGLCVTSAGSIRIVRRQVISQGLDTSHFTGQRRWSDAQFRRAVAHAMSWEELISALGLAGHGDGRVRVKAHAVRLGIDLSRLQAPDADEATPPGLKPDIKHLRDAGASIAATWFLLCGCNASIPVEPPSYDLLASTPDGIKRIQVRTTIYKGKTGWLVQVGRRPYSVGYRGWLIPYDLDALDLFFILDGDLNMYLIPSRVIAGRVQILLRYYSKYSKYIVGNVSSLMKYSVLAEPAFSSVGSGRPADDSGASRRDDALELFSREDVPAR